MFTSQFFNVVQNSKIKSKLSIEKTFGKWQFYKVFDDFYDKLDARGIELPRHGKDYKFGSEHSAAWDKLREPTKQELTDFKKKHGFDEKTTKGYFNIQRPLNPEPAAPLAAMSSAAAGGSGANPRPLTMRPRSNASSCSLCRASLRLWIPLASHLPKVLQTSRSMYPRYTFSRSWSSKTRPAKLLNKNNEIFQHT